MALDFIVTASITISVFLLLVTGLFLVVRLAKQSGKYGADRDSFRAGEKQRDAFDEEVDRPLASGDDLISRLRDRVGR
tara:strand:+ start:204 stop:437 length:234 start_codon:yes stop_codon:yes gene_type:complete